MTETGLVLLSWWLTLALHALILLGSVYLAERIGLLRSPSLRQASWRLALLAPLLTSSVQVASDREPWGGRIVLPTPTASVEAPTMRVPANLRDPGDVLAIEYAPVAELPVAAVSDRSISPVSRPSMNRVPRHDWVALGVSTLIAVAWLWTLLVVAAGVRVLWSWRQERRRSEALSEIAAADVQSEVAQLARLARLPAVRVAADPLLASPAALAPATVCLPPWTVALQPNQRRAMLAHEVAHLSRRDPYWLLVYALLRPLPLAGIARRRLAELAEHACDAWAARQSGGGRALAESLALCMQRRFSGQSAGAFASPMAQARSPLVERVQRLIEDNPMRFERVSLLRRSALVAGLTAALMAMPGVSLIGNPLFAEAVREPAEMPAPPEPPEPPMPPEAPPPPEMPSGAVSPPPPPAIPTPPSPPAPPSPPPPMNLTMEITDTFFGRTTRFSIESADHELSFDVDGKFAFAESEDDLAALDDEATLIEVRDGVTRRLDFERDGDAIERTYSVDGDERPLDADGRRWLAAAILQVLRESGIDADKRVQRIHRQGGATAVLAEVAQVDGDHARGQYLSALLGLDSLNGGELDGALKLVSAMQSDYSKRMALTRALAKQTLATGQQLALLGIVAGFESDYDRRVLLVAAAALPATDVAVEQAWFDALAACKSDYDQRVSLQAILERTSLNEGSLQHVIASIASMDSDYDRRVTLQSVAARIGTSDALARNYIAAVRAIGSDFDQRVALQSLISAVDLSPTASIAVLDAVDQLQSSFERGVVLRSLAARMPADAALITRYRASARGLDDHTRGQVERALDRFQS